MSLLPFDWRGQEPKQTGAAGHDRDGILAIFYTRAVEDKRASRVEGRPVFKDVPFVKIRIPGQSNSEWDQPAKEEDKIRWARAWAAYEAQQDGLADGTPLNEWAYLKPSDVATLRAAGIYTVEQCSAMSDGALGNVGPRAREWRDRAKQFLQGTSETEKQLRAEIAELRATVNMLRQRASVEDADVSPSQLARGIDDVPKSPSSRQKSA